MSHIMLSCVLCWCTLKCWKQQTQKKQHNNIYITYNMVQLEEQKKTLCLCNSIQYIIIVKEDFSFQMLMMFWFWYISFYSILSLSFYKSFFFFFLTLFFVYFIICSFFICSRNKNWFLFLFVLFIVIWKED